MSRPLMLLRITELEALFAEAKRDRSALRKLEIELEHRQVPRARSLLDSVRTALATADADAAAPGPLAPAMPAQPDLGLLSPARSEASGIQRSTPIEVKQVNNPEMQSLIPISEAYKVLKANPGSNWESIELVRRRLVQKASPAGASMEEQPGLQIEANRINAAYRTIVIARLKK